MTIDKRKIHESLAYVHFWEKEGVSRAEAAKYAIRVNLNADEAEILCSALHLKPEEVA